QGIDVDEDTGIAAGDESPRRWRRHRPRNPQAGYRQAERRQLLLVEDDEAETRDVRPGVPAEVGHHPFIPRQGGSPLPAGHGPAVGGGRRSLTVLLVATVVAAPGAASPAVAVRAALAAVAVFAALAVALAVAAGIGQHRRCEQPSRRKSGRNKRNDEYG